MTVSIQSTSSQAVRSFKPFANDTALSVLKQSDVSARVSLSSTKPAVIFTAPGAGSVRATLTKAGAEISVNGGKARSATFAEAKLIKEQLKFLGIDKQEKLVGYQMVARNTKTPAELQAVLPLINDAQVSFDLIKGLIAKL